MDLGKGETARPRKPRKPVPRKGVERRKASFLISADLDERISVHAKRQRLTRSGAVEAIIGERLRGLVISDRGATGLSIVGDDPAADAA